MDAAIAPNSRAIGRVDEDDGDHSLPDYPPASRCLVVTPLSSGCSIAIGFRRGLECSANERCRFAGVAHEKGDHPELAVRAVLPLFLASSVRDFLGLLPVAFRRQHIPFEIDIALPRL
jgi:hypothetical protein